METLQEETTTLKFSQLLKEIYEPAFYQVSLMIRKYNGTLEDAKDIFHDSLVIFYNQKNNNNDIHSDINYLVGIAKHLWFKKIKKDFSYASLEKMDQEQIVIDEPTINQTRLLQFLERTGKRCMELLNSFYLEKLNIAYLAKLYGFKSEHSASVQKYKCIHKIREAIKSKSIVYEDFFE